MKILRALILLAFCFASALVFNAWRNSARVLATAAVPAPQSVVYHPIPAGFDFPADRAALLEMRDTQNVSAIRKHAWMVFAGLTQPTESGEAVWETWFSADQAFSSGAAPQGLAPHRIQRRFRNPRQFTTQGRKAAPQAVGVSLLSFVLFNKEGFDHIRTNQLYKRTKLNETNQAFNTNHTPVEQREIQPFPPEAVSLKTVWWLVKRNTVTAMPIWDGTPAHPVQQPNPPTSWLRFVAVDPTRDQIPPDERRDIMFGGQNKPNSHVVPLKSFYNFQITQNEIDSIRSVRGFDTAEVGDFAALVAMHMTTKEIPDWLWATFWWHDAPNAGNFSNDRPDAVAGVWRNYLMDATLSGDTPKAADDGPKIIFNPWLEVFSSGTVSNCLTCHRRAVWPQVSFLPVTRGRLADNDPFFTNKTKLDFLWSVARESQ